MKIGFKQMIRSVPKELNTDQSTVLEAIQVLGYVTVSMLQLNLGWERARAVAVIDDLVADSLVWVDAQADEKEDEETQEEVSAVSKEGDNDEKTLEKPTAKKGTKRKATEAKQPAEGTRKSTRTKK